MIPITTATEIKHRAILTNAKEFKEKGPEAESLSTKWYDKKPPMDQVMKEAKEQEFDLVIIESVEITMNSYVVE